MSKLGGVQVATIVKSASSAVLSEVKEAAVDVMKEVDDLERCDLAKFSPVIPKKFIFLRERKFTDAEWSLVEKHGLRVYEYDATSIGSRTLDALLIDYDVIIIDIQTEDGRKFWQQWHYTFPREGICVASVCSETPAESFRCSYKIECVVKVFSDFGGDKDAFCRALAGGSLKKPLPWYKRLLRKVLRFFVGVQN